MDWEDGQEPKGTQIGPQQGQVVTAPIGHGPSDGVVILLRLEGFTPKGVPADGGGDVPDFPASEPMTPTEVGFLTKNLIVSIESSAL